MRFVAVDWGTSRLRAYRVADGIVAARASSEDGIAVLTRLGAEPHAVVLARLIGPWLADEPGLPVILAGMVGSREGWVVAPYAACPAGAAEIAAALLSVPIAAGTTGRIVPGLVGEPRPGTVDVMRGEETLALGAGIEDGLVCLPGTHSKWLVMEGGRITRFASFMTGEMYGLLRHHAMIGKPAREPADAAGFADGLAAVEGDPGAGLLHLAFAARAAVVAGRVDPARLGPHLSGLVIGAEIAGARAVFGEAAPVLVADGAQADLYARALGSDPAAIVPPETALVAGLARILGASPPV